MDINMVAPASPVQSKAKVHQQMLQIAESNGSAANHHCIESLPVARHHGLRSSQAGQNNGDSTALLAAQRSTTQFGTRDANSLKLLFKCTNGGEICRGWLTIAWRPVAPYSHSIVPGGLLVTS
jgi:hypothetical protein